MFKIIILVLLFASLCSLIANVQTSKQFKYYVSGSAPNLYSTDTFFGLLWYSKDNSLEIPQKISITWQKDKSTYTAYFWFNEKETIEAFNKFYGSDKGAKAEFIIRIDTDNNKYQICLNNETKTNVSLDKNSFQLIVFKDGYSHCQSDNYDQPKGAWAW